MTRSVPDELGRLLAEVAVEASRGTGLARRWLDGYLPALVEAALRRGDLDPAERDRVEQVAAEAARAGVALPALVRLHLRAAAQVWARLPEVARVCGATGDLDLVRAGAAVLTASDQAVAAVAAGFDAARRLLVRQEEALRREFVADLLDGRGELELLADRAEHVGLRLSAGHVVAVLEAASPLAEADPVVRRLEERVRDAFPGRGVLAARKEGRLVCVVADAPGGTGSSDAPATPVALADVLRGLLSQDTGPGDGEWRTAVGRLRVGPGGVARSYRDALEALDLARRLGLTEPVVLAERLLVYRVLLRDQAAMADLVSATLAPLANARSGPAPLLDVLHAYSAAGGVTTETARLLHLSPRAVTYRLERVRALTGYDPARPDHRLTLEIAAVGARLLGWPFRPLPGA